MFATVIHPSAARLQAFALGDEMTNRNQGTRAHLAACARCRAEVVAIRSLDRDVGALADPTMRSDALARVLEARSRGGRVLLSATDAPTDTPRWARSWKAAVAALLLAIGGLSAVLVRPSSLTAASRNGTLVFAPARPTAGAVVRVSYQAPTDLARWRSLTLRARLRTALDAPYFWTTRQSTIAMLVRGPEVRRVESRT